MEDLCQMCQVEANISLEKQFNMHFLRGVKLYSKEINSAIELGNDRGEPAVSYK
jgi:hypothetical protein